MTLTEQNYYSRESNMKYLSVSQLKSFAGCPAFMGCEERALAELTGEYVAPVSDALLIGSLVDVLMLGTKDEQERFVAEHPEMYASRGKTVGQLKSQYIHALDMVERARRDRFFMRTLEGQHQVILTGKIFGYPFKAKLDVLGDKYITDLKTTKSITEGFYDPEVRRRVSFAQAYRYDWQAGIYTELVRQNFGKDLPFFLAVVSKERIPDIEVMQIDRESMDEAMEELEPIVERVVALKNGEAVPESCGRCDYCREKKVLTAPISWLDVGGIAE